MDPSPYASPRSTQPESDPSSPRLLDTIIFVVNFSGGLLLFTSCVISVVVADNPFAFLGGMFFFIPVAGYMLAEWLCWYRRDDGLYRPLGTVNLIVAAFLAFGLVSNLTEALAAKEPLDLNFLVTLGLIFGLTAAYLGLIGWRRVRRIPSSAMPHDTSKFDEPG